MGDGAARAARYSAQLRSSPASGALGPIFRANWSSKLDAPFGIYEFDEDGKPHWRKHRFADYVKRHHMAWPTYADGSLDERDQTFREMEGRYPQIGPLRELRYSLSTLRLNDLAVGTDGRNRTLLGPYGSKTGRNQPSNSNYVFGPAKWIRFLITPPPGRVLIHRDYWQQEVRIAAVLSGDMALLEACRSDDVYLGIAKQLGFAPRRDAGRRTRPCARCSRRWCWESSTVSAPERLRSRPAFRCSKPPKSWRGCARGSACSRPTRNQRGRSCRPDARNQHAVWLVYAVPARH